MNVVVHAAYITGAIISGTAALILGASLGSQWCYDVFRALDKLAAAMGGNDGLHTISALCGSSTTRTGYVGRVVIDAVFGSVHCRKAAIAENLTPAY